MPIDVIEQETENTPIDLSRRFMRAGAGNTSRSVYQYTDDGTDTGERLVNDYQAIAIEGATDLHVLLTDLDAVNVWLLQGDLFQFDEKIAHLYKPYHLIIVDGTLYFPKEGATQQELQISPIYKEATGYFSPSNSQVFWQGTQLQYDSLSQYDDGTVYLVTL